VGSYKSELGFPVEDSKNFKELEKVLQDKVRRFYVTREMDVTSWIKVLDTKCGNEDTIDEDMRNESLSWRFACDSLHSVLEKMQETAIEILEFTVDKSVRDTV
jgi:hypothetical protein